MLTNINFIMYNCLTLTLVSIATEDFNCKVGCFFYFFDNFLVFHHLVMESQGTFEGLRHSIVWVYPGSQNVKQLFSNGQDPVLNIR